MAPGVRTIASPDCGTLPSIEDGVRRLPHASQPATPTLAVPIAVRSPGWRSDLGLYSALGSLVELDEGWRCELPSFPDNPFGNMLVLRGAPEQHTPDAVAAWFQSSGSSGAVPLCVGWDDPEADVSALSPFVDRGFRAIDDVALAFEGPQRRDRTELSRGLLVGALKLRRLDLAREASLVVACELAVDARRRSPYGPAAVRQGVAWSRAVVALGQGTRDGAPAAQREIGGWYGAEYDGTIVATLGILSVGGEGRLQSVGTHPDYRNRGIGRALLAWAWRDAAMRFGLDRLLLVTARGGDAERFYRRMGFRRAGASLGVLPAD